jgi:type IV pilus assembly protein PilC
MAIFSYVVRDKTNKINNGTVEGTTKDDVAQVLINQGLTPVSITEIKNDNILARLNKIGTIPLSEKVLFSQELATLVNAGVPISQSLEILEKQTSNKKFKEVVTQLAKDVDNGASLSSALEKNPKVFSPLFSNMVKSGEIGGTLDESLNRLAEQMNKDRELVAKIRGAMIYPIVIFIGMIGALIFMMVTIIPKLQGMFDELGGELPAATKSLIFMTKLFTNYGFFTLVAIVAFIVGFRLALVKIHKFRRIMHILQLKSPVIGKLTTKMNVARFSRTLSSLLSSGVGVVEALDIIADSTQNILFKESFERAAERVKNGSTIADTLKTNKIFPVLVPQMVAVGEETGSLDTILKKIADFYDSEIDNITRNLTTLLEPLIMIVIGLLVGYVIVAIITPIYSLTNMV